MTKRNQQRPRRSIVGRNNPTKSTSITTGTYKKQATYKAQAMQHQDPGRHVQTSPPPVTRINPGLTHKANSILRTGEQKRRSGSDSDAHRGRKDHQVHASKIQKEPEKKPPQEDFDKDLRPHNLEGANYGLRGPSQKIGPTAYEIKGLYSKLADLGDEELKRIVIIPEGQRLEQGATYIDLAHLERGEFKAVASMITEPGHYYVAKKETDYVLWNRLNQVEQPERLDESE